MASLASCIFCKIIKGEIPSKKLLETQHSQVVFTLRTHGASIFNLLDLHSSMSALFQRVTPSSSPSEPQDHGEKLHDIPDEYLADVMPVAKKIALATGATDYNILQNNGKIAHQVVPHVHFHVIPKPSASDTEGLVIGWPTKQADQTELQKLLDEMRSRL
ncbi:unnamed protein product [Rhizoctonia solani]|uniref:HIT domain-containing protein n=1 Tax=Rhizoctonia solani TaxID=456999 RepID=A0A8H3A943_9AGAM|nr:unnamed protein product [Rhizoctonia solani]